ncbi:uncharacterized protein LOC126908104 [Daktulosphaira vitifoliae]|uniref:uncharacterized protein LOC126908104 n=1 Tax=Daktulosphaira vitifoliae TaxID=58002 RepID=UPI0021AA9A19|nr:uncharacterized protein LOC126908104 [Daktulosphaira vitifoliae]
MPGLFSDETSGLTLFEIAALRSKCYAFDMEGSELIKSKGIRGHVVRNHLSLNDNKRCLFKDDDDGDDASTKRALAGENARAVIGMIRGAECPPTLSLPYTPYRQNMLIRSFEHEVRTLRTTKLALNRFDDKRYTLNNRIDILIIVKNISSRIENFFSSSTVVPTAGSQIVLFGLCSSDRYWVNCF